MIDLKLCYVCGDPLADDALAIQVTRHGERAHRRCQRAYWKGVEWGRKVQFTRRDDFYFPLIGAPRFPASNSLVYVSLREFGDELHVITGEAPLVGTPTNRLVDWMRRRGHF